MRKNRFDSLLNTLNESELLSADFPRRNRYTHAEYIGLSEGERLRLHEPGLIAIGRAKNFEALAEAVRQLGKAKHAAAVPLLAELWSDCALQPVRDAAGHALRDIGTTEARRALLELIEDSDDLSVYLAVAAVFDEDVTTAFARFSHYFDPDRVAQPDGAVIPNVVLANFVPSSFSVGRNGKEIPRWTESRAPSWLQKDPRWIELCVARRHDKQLGQTARAVLRYADQTLVGPVLEEAEAREGPRIVRPATRAIGNLLARYRRGDHVGVWTELRSHEALGGELLEEARAVAQETMLRVSRNADRLAERLAASGWRPLYSELRAKPVADDQEVMRRIEEISGAPLPVSLRAFWEVVGGINFVWDYNGGAAPGLGIDLPLDEMDPLCVGAPGEVTYLFEEWEDQRSGVDPELADPFSLDLAPDYLHKANISGGGPYGIELPFLGADPVFANEVHVLPFVDYLRLCFRWAGFPRLERHATRRDVRHFLEEVTRGFEPF
ncbi:MAG: HEAT repeat domain-containing protein [Pirellulaceae bacterium]